MANAADQLRDAYALHMAGKLLEALEGYRQVLAIHANFAPALHLAGLASHQLGDATRGLELLEQATAQDASHWQYHSDRGCVLEHLGRLDEAEQAHRTAAQLAPDQPVVLNNLGSVLVRQGRNEEAAEVLHAALDLDPNFVATLCQIGNLLIEQGNHTAAIDYFDRALAIDPQCHTARADRGLARLHLGQFETGWDDYESRWLAKEGLRPRTEFNQPLWDGSSLAGKTILVHGEQGLGDEIMFATCLPEVMAAAKHCILLCDPRLVKLLTRSFPTVEVHGVARGEEPNWQPPADRRIDVQTPLGSLPRWLRRSTAAFPIRKTFLQAVPARRLFWQDWLALLPAGMKVGISWRAGIRPDGSRAYGRARRSIELSQCQTLLNIPHCQFINLQYGLTDQDQEELDQLGTTIHRHPRYDPTEDFADLAALISELDLVISVGNAAVHVAGAVGTSAWALVPYASNWSWTRDREMSLWYSTVRMLRQPVADDWTPVLSQVATELHPWALTRSNEIAIASSGDLPLQRSA